MHSAELTQHRKVQAPSALDNTYLFDVIVIRIDGETCKYEPARGKMDTFADCNVTTSALLERTGHIFTLEDVEGDVVFTLVGGMRFQPKKKVNLKWRTANSMKVYATEFYVSEADEPFEILFGLDFIKEHGDVTRGSVSLFSIVKHESRGKSLLRSQVCVYRLIQYQRSASGERRATRLHERERQLS